VTSFQSIKQVNAMECCQLLGKKLKIQMSTVLFIPSWCFL